MWIITAAVLALIAAFLFVSWRAAIKLIVRLHHLLILIVFDDAELGTVRNELGDVIRAKFTGQNANETTVAIANWLDDTTDRLTPELVIPRLVLLFGKSRRI